MLCTVEGSSQIFIHKRNANKKIRTNVFNFENACSSFPFYLKMRLLFVGRNFQIESDAVLHNYLFCKFYTRANEFLIFLNIIPYIKNKGILRTYTYVKNEVELGKLGDTHIFAIN